MFLKLTDSLGHDTLINSYDISSIKAGKKYSFVHMNNGDVHYISESIKRILAMLDGD